MNQITIEELSAYLPFKVPAKLSKKGIFNQDNEYPNTEVYKLGFIESYSIGKNNTFDFGVLKLPNNYSFDFESLDEIVICLRPLSQLTTEIEVNGEKFVPIDRLEELYQQLGYDNYSYYFIMPYPKRLPYEIVQLLLSWHFDIFGLIDRNLAEPIV
jgi:hypothetical protein